ncbi:MAG: PhoH family protein [bacterium]
MKLKKTFILDTNVLLLDPNAIFAFEDNNVVIPLAVIEEIDDKKTRQDMVGFNARETSRRLDQLRKKGALNEGVTLEHGGILTVVADQHDVEISNKLPHYNKMDNRILRVALNLKRNLNDSSKIIVVSKDMNLRIKADVLALEAEDYKKNQINFDTLFSGHQVYSNISSKDIDDFYKQDFLSIDKLCKEDRNKEFFPHEFATLNNGNKSAIARFDSVKKGFMPLVFEKISPWGIRPRNREQKFALELLLNDNIKLVTLIGKAGTGKTLLALAAGLYKVLEEEQYTKLSVARPIVPMGNDIGYLPGDKEEKLRPWMQPIYDNLEYLFDEAFDEETRDSCFDFVEEKKFIEVEALSYIRGRSIPNHFIIIDEAQNLSQHEIKTIVTRVGINSKIIFTGDPYQIDSPYLDRRTNGLTYLAQKFKDKKIAGHITLEKGERSELAEIASKVL